MKVYIINANWAGGGPGGIAKDLYYTCLDNGHQVRFAFSRGSIDQSVNSFRYGNKSGVLAHALFARLFDKAGFYSKAGTRQLVADIRKFNPDVISIHNPLGYTLNIPMLFKFIDTSAIPTFYTLHDCWLFTGHCIFPNECEKYKDACGKCPKKKEFPASYFLDNSKNNLSFKRKNFSTIRNLYLISCSQWICNLAKKTYLKSYNNLVINNGIDLDIFRFHPNNFKQKHFIENKIMLLGVASVWSERKGESFFAALSEIIPTNWVIVLVGRGLSKKVRTIKNIICIEATSNPYELASIYSASDVFVNPTTGDNYPTVNLEALACGVPVVTFDTGGSGEMISKYGEIVKQGDLEGLYIAINRVLRKHFDKNEMLAYAQAFDKKKKFKQYLELFNDTILKKNGSI